MDPLASLTVAKGVMASFLFGTAAGAALGISKRESLRLYAISGAVNSGIIGLTFFGLREFFISPLLLAAVPMPQFIRRRQELSARVDKSELPPQPPLAWSDIRLNKLPDTMLTGAIAAGGLNTLRRGRAGILPGTITGALLTGIVQLAVNEFEVARIKFVSRSLDIEPPPAADKEPLLERMKNALGTLAPLRRISDVEHVEVLKRRRDETDTQLQKIRQELQEAQQEKSEKQK